MASTAHNSLVDVCCSACHIIMGVSGTNYLCKTCGNRTKIGSSELITLGTSLSSSANTITMKEYNCGELYIYPHEHNKCPKCNVYLRKVKTGPHIELCKSCDMFYSINYHMSL